MLICEGETGDPAGLQDSADAEQRLQYLFLSGVALDGRLPGVAQARGRDALTELDVSPGILTVDTGWWRCSGSSLASR